MKKLRAKARVEAFTLIEILAIVAVFVILAAMLLPANHGPRRAYQPWCMSNQKQIAIGCLMWTVDYQNRFPWQVSTFTNGAMELIPTGYTCLQFRTLAEYLRDSRIFICPTDKTKHKAENVAEMRDESTSYFVNVNAEITNSPAHTILTGDRHLQWNKAPVKPGLFIYTNGMDMDWTRELHGDNANSPVGILSFADGHAERVLSRDSTLTKIFSQQQLATARLLVP